MQNKKIWPYLLLVPVFVILDFLMIYSLLKKIKPLELAMVAEPTPTPVAQKKEPSSGIRLLKSLALSVEGNVFISPVSINQALAMVYHGSRGQTREEIGELLGEAKSGIKLPPITESELDIANSIWVNEALAPVGKVVNPEYVADLKKDFGAYFGLVNSNQPGSGNKVNKWVATNTKNKITQMVPSETNPATIMYIVNAVYFKGMWDTDYEFDPALTEDGSFEGELGSLMVPMMEQENTYLHLESPTFQAVEIPYGRTGESVARFYLPKPGKMTAFLEEMGSDKLSEWDEMFEMRMGRLKLPKFKLENSYELGPTLEQMGMKTAFGPEANFDGGMVLPGTVPVQLSKVVHKTFVEVNEKGTEAAAATAVLPMAGGGPDPDLQPFVMEINRPFMMLIKIRGVSEPLFMGLIRSIGEE